jgi:hypothetical protein
MPEETTTTEATADSFDATQSTEMPTSYVNDDGTFKEGWRDKLIPADVHTRNKMIFSGMNNVNDLINQIDNQALTISRQGKGIFPPTQDSSEHEVKAFYKAIGVPDTPDGYTLNIPDDVKHYYQDEESMNEARSILHGLNLTPKQFAGVMELDAQRMRKSEEMMKADPMEFYEHALDLAMPIMAQEAEKELRLKWGQAYDTRMHLANAAITENTQEGDERDRLLERIGNDPLVADFIATIQNKHYTESHGVDTSLGGGVTAKNVEQQIAEITSKLTPQLKLQDRPQYDALLSAKTKLYAQLHPGD